MGDLHDLHDARPDLAYSAFHALGGAAIPPARCGAVPLFSQPPFGGVGGRTKTERVRLVGDGSGRCGF